MSAVVKEILRECRPPGPPGRADKYLPEIARDLRSLLEKTQRQFVDRSVAWPVEYLSDLAAVLVEFGEDIHFDCGLWRGLEDCNREIFGSPLPLAAEANLANAVSGFDPRRIQHLIWTLWMAEDAPGLPGPGHANLLQLAKAAGTFLADRFSRLPMDSGVKNFLAGPSGFAWEVKRKLVWLGTRSYLMRWLFSRHLVERDEEASIGTVDDFVCQECTVWSGLGVIDILAGALDVPAEDRATLRSWYERHAAFYRVVSRQDRGNEVERMVARNIINGRPYNIRMNMPGCPFLPGMVAFGSLIPWRGEWYWSGEQRLIEHVAEASETILRQEMLKNQPGVAYRYCPAEAAVAREVNRKQHADYLAYFGDDFVVYADGRSLSAAEQKRLEASWLAIGPERVQEFMREHGVENSRPSVQFPPNILNHKEGIGAFYNPEEGLEFLTRFNYVLSGLRKQGAGLSEPEREAVWRVVTHGDVSPAFVQRLVREHGAASLLAVFHLLELPPERALLFLLRCHKGAFYRNRYPLLTVV